MLTNTVVDWGGKKGLNQCGSLSQRDSCAITVISSCIVKELITAGQHKPLSAENRPRQFGIWNWNLLLLGEKENKGRFGGVTSFSSLLRKVTASTLKNTFYQRLAFNVCQC